MIRVGITGQTGFVGTHLYNTLGLYSGEFECIPFEDNFFENKDLLCAFIKRCDVIVHLAAMNRHPDPMMIYHTNLDLIQRLITVMEEEKCTPYILFSSSTQETCDNEYGRSKREGRMLLEEWASRNGASFTGMVVPNVYGPFGQPNYNSFVATFCHKLTHNETPVILRDSSVRLIYVGNLCLHIIDKIREVNQKNISQIERDIVPFDFEKRVTEVLALLENYKELYFDQGFIPVLRDNNEINLFNTYCSYIDFSRFYPRKLIQHTDTRGIFVETAKLGIGGQVSFSTTALGVTRGNHYHTRKIERFIVIKGKARVQLRKVGTDEILNFYFDGNEPAYLDTPIWYCHNITNIGEEELYTQFWISEWYNLEDGDTYFESVEK